MTDASERLNKLLALSLGVSRREADELIARGDVKVNDSVVLLGARVSPADEVTVKGKSISRSTELIYLAFNKPIGYVCSRASQGGVPTIYELLPEHYHSLKTVGRLDKDSSGLILLTNDGDFAFRMTHPKFHKVKIYEVELNSPLQPLHQQMISDYGVTLDDGVSKFELERLDDTRLKWRITMSEGRNRQIRRTFTALGYSITRLHRTNFGPYTLGDIPTGQWKIISIS